MKRALIVTGLTVGLFTATVGTAWADSVDTAIDELRNSAIYVDPDATLTVDEGEVTDAIGSHNMQVALLPPDAGAPSAVLNRMRDLGLGTHVVFVGDQVGAESSDFAPGTTGEAAIEVAGEHASDLAEGDATSTLVAMVDRFNTLPRANSGQEQQGQGQGQGGNVAPRTETAPKKAESNGGTVLLVILLIAVVGIVGAVFWSRRRKRKAQEKLIAERRAEIMPLYDRLANDVSTLNAGDDEVAQQALADASERFTATGAKLATAKTDADFDACHRTVVEGLYATRTARTALGLDPGPALPSPSTAGDRMDGPSEVTVNGQTYQGYPEYTPGAPNYYPGGHGYAAGWYSFPFWETLLIGSMLTGGFGAFGGWGFGGGGFDHGYESGYDAGMDDAMDQMDAGGGEGGGDFGGGDFGGGDFGGDFGGGDFGGGDFGGGDFGGGDW